MNEDAFLTQEDKDAQANLARLEQQAHEGALFEDWMRHQAGQKFSKYLESEITDAKNKWLSATDREAAEVVRLQAQVYQKIKGWINAQISAGKLASVGIKKFSEEGVKLEGWIKNQSSTVRPE